MSKDKWGPLGPPQGDWMDIWRLAWRPEEKKKEKYNWLQRFIIRMFKLEKK